jgi:DNA-binding XRE family transcriptional regulator
MRAIAMHPRTKEQLDKLTPEQRAKAEALMVKHRTPEARARQAEAVDAIEAEVAATGGITTADGTLHRVRSVRPLDVDLAPVGRALRARREALGLSLDDAARSSGVERSALAKIERGANPNPTIGTLARVARALGGRVAIEFEPWRGGHHE